jgi:predicted phosphodiesterase
MPDTAHRDSIGSGKLRVVGDVHGQITADDVMSPAARPYLELIQGAAATVQIGDLGDGETYEQLIANVDPQQHRFFPGNHDHYDCLPPHCLGDFGSRTLGDVEFFFLRGAASTDRDKLLRLGRELGKTLWFAEEELSEKQMQLAEQEYLLAKPTIVLTHDAPTESARYAWNHARQRRRSSLESKFYASRTSEFLARLLVQHAPRLWVFGHHHHDCRCQVDDTMFICVGELSVIDISADGIVLDS